MTKSWLEKPEDSKNIFEFLHANNDMLNIENTSDDLAPEDIVKSLSLWALLYDVPFQYLVASEELLPEESIRFFHMDYDFLYAMLDGALSLGRFFDVDYNHDKELINNVLQRTLNQRFSIRPVLQGKMPQLKERDFSGNGVVNDTGFLLRSELVKGWRGLEFKAMDKNNNVLTALRIETLGPGVLLGIYEGEINRLEIAQPAEGLHYGFTQKPGGGYEKRLRSMENGKLYKDAKHFADVEMRSSEKRVINFGKTAKNIGDKLDIKNINSANIALQMIQNPLTGVIEHK